MVDYSKPGQSSKATGRVSHPPPPPLTFDYLPHEATRRALARLREDAWVDRLETDPTGDFCPWPRSQRELALQVPTKMKADAAKSWAEDLLACYEWKLFVTLTFRPNANHEEPAPEAAEKAARAWLAEIHQELYGDVTMTAPQRCERSDGTEYWQGAPVGIRYVLAIERGKTDRHVHCHMLLAGGDAVGHARWEPWADRWRERHGYIRIEKPENKAAVQTYCSKYVIKGGELQLSSTWEDARARERELEAPLFQAQAVGQEITPSAEWQHRGKLARAIADGAPCRRCGLISLCRCESEENPLTARPGDSARFNGPEPDATQTRKHGTDEAPAVPAKEEFAGAPRLPQREMFSPVLRGALAPKTVSVWRARRRARGHSRLHVASCDRSVSRPRTTTIAH
jgi:hypothetical protein